MDIGFLLWLQGLREIAPELVNQFFLLVSQVGGSSILFLVPALLYWCLDKRTGTLVILGATMGSVVNQLVKNTVCCYRPWVRDASVRPSQAALPDATGYSFPSGHTQMTANVVGATGWYYRRRRPILLVATILWVLLMAFSRNYLGVHTPQDVLVALVESVLVIAFVDKLIAWVERRDGRDSVVLVASVVGTVAFIAYVTLRTYPTDYDTAGTLVVDPYLMQIDCFKSIGIFAGAIVGWYLERRFLRFEVRPHEAGWKRMALRLLVGLVVVGGLHLAPRLASALIADARWFEFLKNSLTGVAALYLAPLVFTKLNL